MISASFLAVKLFALVAVLASCATCVQCEVRLDPFETRFVDPREVSASFSITLSGNITCKVPCSITFRQGGIVKHTAHVDGFGVVQTAVNTQSSGFGTSFWHVDVDVDELDSQVASITAVEAYVITHETLPQAGLASSIAARHSAVRLFDTAPGMRSSCAQATLQSALYLGDFGQFGLARRLFHAASIPSYALVDVATNCTTAAAQSSVPRQCLQGSAALPMVDLVLLGTIPEEMLMIVGSVLEAFDRHGKVILSASHNWEYPNLNSYVGGYVTTSWAEWRIGISKKEQPWLLLAHGAEKQRQPLTRAHVLSVLVPVAVLHPGTMPLSLALLEATTLALKQRYETTIRVLLLVVSVDNASQGAKLLHAAAAAIRRAGGDPEVLAGPAFIDWSSVDILLDLILVPSVVDVILLSALSRQKSVIAAGFSTEGFLASAVEGLRNIVCSADDYTIPHVLDCFHKMLSMDSEAAQLTGRPSTELARTKQVDNGGHVRLWLSGVQCTLAHSKAKQTSETLFRIGDRLLQGHAWVQEGTKQGERRGAALAPASSQEDARTQAGEVKHQALASYNDSAFLRAALFRQDNPSDTLKTAAAAKSARVALGDISLDVALSRVLSCPSQLVHRIGFLENLFTHQPHYEPLLDHFLCSLKNERRRVLAAMDGNSASTSCAIATDALFEAANGLIGHPLYRDLPRVWTSPVLNPTLDFAAIETDYASNAPGLTYFDSLLTKHATDELLRFAQQSDVYFDEKPGYIGAYPQHGFVHPALVRLVEELRAAMPDLLKDYAVENIWSYKAMQDTPKALGLHADDADLNFNFWITDSSANIDPDSGGLVVYQTVAPANWTFSQYNDVFEQDSMRQYLLHSGATRVVIRNTIPTGALRSLQLVAFPRK